MNTTFFTTSTGAIDYSSIVIWAILSGLIITLICTVFTFDQIVYTIGLSLSVIFTGITIYSLYKLLKE